MTRPVVDAVSWSCLAGAKEVFGFPTFFLRQASWCVFLVAWSVDRFRLIDCSSLSISREGVDIGVLSLAREIRSNKPRGSLPHLPKNKGLSFPLPRRSQHKPRFLGIQSGRNHVCVVAQSGIFLPPAQMNVVPFSGLTFIGRAIRTNGKSEPGSHLLFVCCSFPTIDHRLEGVVPCAGTYRYRSRACDNS
jgi:hypothetical protein